MKLVGRHGRAVLNGDSFFFAALAVFEKYRHKAVTASADINIFLWCFLAR